MAINPNEYTISYSQLLRSTTIRDRVSMAQSDNTFYSQLAQALTPTQMANLFPRYYRDRLPDISGFNLATEQIAAGTFGKGLPTSVATGEASEVVTSRPTKTRGEFEADADRTGKRNEEKLRKSLPGNVRTAFDEVVRKKKARAFSTTDDPFSGLSDEELKTIGIKRIQRSGPQAEAGSFYVKDTLSVVAAKQKVLNQYKTQSEVTGFKFEDAPATFKDNDLTGNYYRTHGAGMGNKEDNSRIQTELANYIAKKGKEAGYTDAAIKGMVANAMSESWIGLLPYGDHGGSGGVFHLHVRGAAAEAGVDPKKYHVNKSNVKDVDEYIASMKDSIDVSFDLFQNDNSYASLNKLMKTSNDFNETTTAFVRDFEKPKVVNAADRIQLAKKLGIDVATLEETISEADMPKFVQSVKTMDDETLEKLGGIIETGPGGLGAGVNIVDIAEKLQTPDEINNFETRLAEIYEKRGLSESPAEKIDGKAASGSFIKGYDPSEDYTLPGKGNATSDYAENQFMPAMNFIGGLGLGKAIGENPYVRQGVFNPEGTESITGHSPKGHHRGAHGALAADISSGSGVRPEWVKHVGSQEASLEINRALGNLMFNDEMVRLLKPTELINQDRRVASSSGWRYSKGGHGHPNHVHFAPSREVSAETYNKVRQLLFTNPEYFGDEGRNFAETMVKHGLWSKTDTGFELSRDKYAEFYEQQKEEEIKAKSVEEKKTPKRELVETAYPYADKSFFELQKMFSKVVSRGINLKDGSEESYANQRESGAIQYAMSRITTEDLEKELEILNENATGEDIPTILELETELYYRKKEEEEARREELGIGSDVTGEGLVLSGQDPEKYGDSVKEDRSHALIKNSESEATQLGTTRFYEGGTFEAKDNLKVVREDGSPTGIRVASDETAVIIPPDERRKARDIVSLDGTDQRTGLDSMDEEVSKTNPIEAPLNQAKMSSGAYQNSNQSTIPSSLGAIDYSPSALRAFARDKYVDNHGFHSAPRTIYAQK